MPAYTGLSEVYAGWTGNVSITVSATAVAITATERESAIDLWLRIIRKAEIQFGGDWVTFVDIAGRIVVIPPANTTIDATLETESRLGLSGSLVVSANTVGTFPSAHAGGFYPRYGMAFDAPDLVTSTGAVTAGSAEAQRPIAGGVEFSIEAFDTIGQIIPNEVDLGDGKTYDISRNGAILARFWSRGARRNRWGVQASQVTLRIDCVSVSRDII